MRDLYYYRSEGQEDGPVDADKLLELFETHMITAFDEVRRDGDGGWLSAQEVVTGILEARKSGGARPRPAAKSDGTAASGGIEVGEVVRPKEPNVLVAQRGAKAPKAEGAISDEDLAKSHQYARREMQRGRHVRAVLMLLVILAGTGAALRYSADLHASKPGAGASYTVETELTIEAGKAGGNSGRGALSGSGTFTAVRRRIVTHTSDTEVTMLVDDQPIRWMSDFTGGADYSETIRPMLRGQNVTFTATEEGWQAKIEGGVLNPRIGTKLNALAFDNSALYPTRRLFPWPWQTWKVTQPAACSALGLDLEGCTAEVELKLVGFAGCGADRCAKLTFKGKWDGLAEGDTQAIELQGTILRSLASGLDHAVEATGTLVLRRTIQGAGDTTLTGPVVLRQSMSPAS